MPTYKVWDPDNEKREDARDVVAFDADSAAEKYADDDTDGQLDGIYEDGKDICVALDDEEPRTFVVSAINSPTFHASEKRS